MPRLSYAVELLAILLSAVKEAWLRLSSLMIWAVLWCNEQCSVYLSNKSPSSSSSQMPRTSRRTAWTLASRSSPAWKDCGRIRIVSARLPILSIPRGVCPVGNSILSREIIGSTCLKVVSRRGRGEGFLCWFWWQTRSTMEITLFCWLVMVMRRKERQAKKNENEIVYGGIMYVQFKIWKIGRGRVKSAKRAKKPRKPLTALCARVLLYYPGIKWDKWQSKQELKWQSTVVYRSWIRVPGTMVRTRYLVLLL